MRLRPQTAIAALVLGAVASMSGCLLQPTGADCDAARSCADCAARSGCGWCDEGGGACRAGSSLGDDVGACGSEAWWFAGCPGGDADCDAIASCADCRAQGCGWCLEDERCKRGDRRGAADGSCALDQWVVGGRSCDYEACWRARDCGSCLARGCEWCAAGGFCQHGSVSACLDPDYVVDPGGRCPDSDACHEASRCGDCAATPGCAYCYSRDSLGEVEVQGCYPEAQCPRSSDFGATEVDACP